jgi:hypothetical protein
VCSRGGGTAAHRRASSDSGSISTAWVPSFHGFLNVDFA